MNLDAQRIDRILVISRLIFILIIIFTSSCHGWHKTLTFVQQSSYESSKINMNKFFFLSNFSLLIVDIDDRNQMIISDMKFFQWYHSYAIYGARETLILLKPILNNSSVSDNFYFVSNWSFFTSRLKFCRTIGLLIL